MKEDRIKIVGVNTRMEHPQIVRRILDNCDVVLLPKYKPHEIVENTVHLVTQNCMMIILDAIKMVQGLSVQ